MKRLILLISILVLSTSLAFAGYVNGYTRSNGTYVKGYYRSDRNSVKSDNYGPSQSDSQSFSPSTRDYDNDGIPNRYDYDDDNDGIGDNYDSDQYNASSW